MTVLKQIAINMLKGVAVVAALVALFVPLRSFNEYVIFFGSVIVGVASLVAWTKLDADGGIVSFWRRKTEK